MTMIPYKAIPRHECGQARRTQWYLMVDADRFHVYVGARIEGQRKAVRIDWHDNSQLEFKRVSHFPRNHEAIPIGVTRCFCSECIVARLRNHMREYRLFTFNCRTVSYLILTRALEFDANRVYAHFVNGKILCGLNQDECLSLEEIHHYFAWRDRNAPATYCTLI